MSLRQYLERIQNQNLLIQVFEPISHNYDIAAVLKKLEPKPVIFHNVINSEYKVIGNLLCTKAAVAEYFNIQISEIIPFLAAAIDNRSAPKITNEAPCQEIVLHDPDLDKLPILKHFENDGGRYITSGIIISKHSLHGQNVDFHRCMQISKTEMAMRVVQSRHFDTFLKDKRSIDVAICIGNPANVVIAAATSVSIGVDELEIANALKPLDVVKAKTVDVFIPAECEFVLEGTVYLDRTHDEGPFVDLTETQDIIRREPVFVVKMITHRKDAMWQALLPGSLEHKLLMGMPREPTIYKKVNEVVKCLDVNITPGGCSWLHAIVQIDKEDEDDGKKAISAAFDGHQSCKHVFIVDKDIDIYNSNDVEWAFATRFQGDSDMVVKKERGSSLDPSAEVDTHITTKIGFDLTKPLIARGKNFNRISYPEVNLHRYIK